MANNHSVKQDTLKGIKWATVEKISLQGIQFIIGIILARILSPKDFGTVGMLTIFIGISHAFVDGGFANALVRKKDKTDTDFSTAFYFNIGVGIVCYSILFLLSPWIAIFFHTPILNDLLKVLAITLFINSLSIVQIARLTISINFKAQAKATVIASILSGIIGIGMAYSGMGVWSLAWQQVFSAIFKTIIVWYQAHWRPKLVFSMNSFRNLFSYGSKLLASNLIGTIYKHLTTIFIGRFYTAKDLGFYSRGQHFAHMPSDAIMTSLTRVTFPILAKLQDDDNRLIDVYRKYIKTSSLVVMFFLTLLASIAKPLILLVLTEKWANSIIFLQIFCFAYMFEHISRINLNLLQVKGRSDLYLRLEIIKKIIAFCILMVSVPFGVIIICLSKIVNGQIALFVNTYYTGKLFNLGYFKQFGDFGKYFVLAVISCIPSYLICSLDLSPWIQIPISCSLAILIYCMCLHKDKHYIELKLIITDKFKKQR